MHIFICSVVDHHTSICRKDEYQTILSEFAMLFTEPYDENSCSCSNDYPNCPLIPRSGTVEDSVLGLSNSTSGLASCYGHKCARCATECPECRHRQSCSSNPKDEPVTTKGVASSSLRHTLLLQHDAPNYVTPIISVMCHLC